MYVVQYTPTFVDQLDVDYISHHGIKGMKWGVRRYQNADGTRTAKGKIHDRQTSKKRRGLTKSQKELLKGTGLALGTMAVTGASLYALDKYMTKSANDNVNRTKAKWDREEAKYRKERDEYRRKADQAEQDYKKNYDNYQSYRDRQREEQYQRQRQAKQAADEGSVKSKQHYESTGKNVYDNLVGKYGKTKARDVAKQDLDAAKKRVADAMKRAAEEERNGGRTVETMNEVRKAREARKAAQAVYEQFNTDEQPKQNSSTTTKKSNTSTNTQRKTTSTPKSSSTRKTNTSNKNRQSIRYLQTAS